MLVHLSLKFFVVQDALLSQVVGNEHLQKVIYDIILVLNFFKLHSNNVFEVVVYSNEGINSDPLLAIVFVIEVFQSLRGRTISLVEEYDIVETG